MGQAVKRQLLRSDVDPLPCLLNFFGWFHHFAVAVIEVANARARSQQNLSSQHSYKTPNANKEVYAEVTRHSLAFATLCSAHVASTTLAGDRRRGSSSRSMTHCVPPKLCRVACAA